MPCGFLHSKMNTIKNIPIFLCLFSNLFLVTPVFSSESAVIGVGEWPESATTINGSESKSENIIFSNKKIKIYKENIQQSIIYIDQNTVVYAPENAKVRAESKVYTHPELSEEVKKFYTQGLGTYAFGAIMIGVAMALR